MTHSSGPDSAQGLGRLVWPSGQIGPAGPTDGMAWCARGGTATSSEQRDEVWRRRWLRHGDHCGRVPDKVSGAEAHRSGRSMMRWAEAAQWRCPSMEAALRWPSMALGGFSSTRSPRGRRGVTLIRRKGAQGLLSPERGKTAANLQPILVTRSAVQRWDRTRSSMGMFATVLVFGTRLGTESQWKHYSVQARVIS
jgi:hypothetical protein